MLCCLKGLSQFDVGLRDNGVSMPRWKAYAKELQKCVDEFSKDKVQTMSHAMEQTIFKLKALWPVWL